jgi:predicted PurR-regulated permease PerM
MAVSSAKRERAAWWAGGAALALVVAFVLYSFVGTFVFGLFIYYATRPVYRRIAGRVGRRSVAAALSIFALALPALLLVAYTIAVGLQEFDRAADRFDITRFEEILGPYIDVSAVVQDPQSLLGSPNAVEAIRPILTDALGYLGFIGNALLHLFVMIGIAYYLLKDDRRLAAWFRRRFLAEGGAGEMYGRAVDRDFSNIFFGNILNAALTAVIGAFAYNALAFLAPAGMTIPYPTLLGLLTGAGSLIPIVGMKLVYFPVTGYLVVRAASHPDLLWFPATFALVSFVVVDVIPDLVLRPYVSGRGLHLGMVMFAYIFGPLLFGWYGIFLGPMLLVFLVHFARLVLPELLLGRPIEPEELAAVDLAGEPIETGEAGSGGGEESGDEANAGGDESETPKSDQPSADDDG